MNTAKQSLKNLSLVALIALAVITVSTSRAATWTRTAAAGPGSWHDTGNWLNGILPSASDGALMQNGGAAVINNNITTLGFVMNNNTNNRVYQQAGAVVFGGDVSIGNAGTTVYEISGGSLDTNARFFNYARFRVLGSGATSITIGGSAGLGGSGIYEFRLDNSASHITTVVLDGSNKNRAGTLNVSLDGGVLLSASKEFTIVQASSGNLGTTTWTGSTLWTLASNQSGGTYQYDKITLAGGQDRGDLDFSAGGGSASFAAANTGYIDLLNLTGSDMQIGLDLGTYAQGDLDLFTAGLTAAGISWAAGSGDYDLALTLDPSVSGGNYFAWDFTSYGGLQLSGIGNLIPEPTSLLLLGLAGLSLLFRRGYRRA